MPPHPHRHDHAGHAGRHTHPALPAAGALGASAGRRLAFAAAATALLWIVVTWALH